MGGNNEIYKKRGRGGGKQRWVSAIMNGWVDGSSH